MKIASFLLVLLLALLSIAAGLAKVLQTPQEMEFLQGVGLSPAMIIAFGCIQFGGGVLLIIRSTRVAGAALAALAFLASAILLFIGGNTAFGWISIIPFALTVVIGYKTLTAPVSKPRDE